MSTYDGYHREYYQRNKKRICEKQRLWRKKDSKQRRKQGLLSRQTLANKRWREKNLERHRKYERERMRKKLSDPVGRAAHNAYCAKWQREHPEYRKRKAELAKARKLAAKLAASSSPA